jgi:hypothetical protein
VEKREKAETKIFSNEIGGDLMGLVVERKLAHKMKHGATRKKADELFAKPDGSNRSISKIEILIGSPAKNAKQGLNLGALATHNGHGHKNLNHIPGLNQGNEIARGSWNNFGDSENKPSNDQGLSLKEKKKTYAANLK